MVHERSKKLGTGTTQPACDVFISAQQVSNMYMLTMTFYDVKVDMHILPTLQTHVRHEATM
jgi:hypothetical protein